MKPHGRLRLGELLVEARIISPAQLEQVLALQQSDGRRLGTLLVERGFIGETQLTQILSQQLSVPWVSLHHIDFSRMLLSLVPRDTCERYCLVPIYVRSVRGQGDVLYVAMDDPMNEEALAACAQSAGLPARAMIAAPSDIRAAIRIYYAAGPARSRPPAAPAGSPPAASDVAVRQQAQAPPKAAGDAVPHTVPSLPLQPPFPPAIGVVDAAASLAPSASAPPSSGTALPSAHASPDAAAMPPALAAPPGSQVPPAPPDDGPRVEFREVEIPLRAKKGRTFSLTLLDGTTLALPVGRRRPGSVVPGTTKDEPAEAAPAAGADESLTVSEILSALRALSHGADPADDVQGYVRWEKLVAALLTLLVRKRLIMPREFIEELKRI